MICLTKVSGGKVFIDPAAIKSASAVSGAQTLVTGEGFERVYVEESVVDVVNARHDALFGELTDDEAADYIADLEDDVAVLEERLVEDDAETLALQLDRANEMIVELMDRLGLYVTAVDAIEGSLEKFFNGTATHFLNSHELSHDVVEAIATLDEALEEFGEDE